MVICGNQFIANWFSKWNPNVRLIATAVDTQLYIPASRAPREDCVVGWIGTSPGFPYLKWLEDVFLQIVHEHPTATIRIVSSEMPRLESLPPGRLEFRSWSQETELVDIQDFDIGIMPLFDTELARGKCGFKMLQYMSCGIPVIASPVGVNRDILNRADFGIAALSKADWTEALQVLIRDPAKRAEMGRLGRTRAMFSYDTRISAALLGDALRSLL
jgi:glycosyltransferase involved in cell wall biosynthesis